MMKALAIAVTGTFLALAMQAAVRSGADTRAKPGDVTEARVISEAADGTNWLVGGRTFDEQHFSPLTQVTDKNVGALGLAWALDIYSATGMSSEPIVVDGVIYVTAPRSVVYAVDAVSGKVLWTFAPKLQVGMDKWQAARASRTNRGVAVWAGKVYVGTGDCRLLAIDAASGKQLWESPVCDPKQTGITGAPHAGKGKVYIGYYGADTGVRGSVPAFDAETGKEVWRFWTVPGDPAKFESSALEMAAKTWSGDQWWTAGGGAVWDPITYDPETGLVFIGTSGATPGVMWADKAGMKLGGDRLFANAIVAINAETGKYVWHYQTGTENNHTENVHIVIADLVIEGQKRHVAMTAPKNGFFYVLDARTGQLLSASKIAKVAWATSIDLKTGRPVEVSIEQQRAQGGRNWTVHNWFPMSYSAQTGLVYVPLTDLLGRTTPTGENVLGGRLLAWDPVKQSTRWSVEQPLQVNGGVLSTAGNLVFNGEATGEFAAYAADSGSKVWSIKTGSAIQATPVSFKANGDQYVVVPVGMGSGSRNFNRGSNLGTPESKRGPARLLAFKLGAKTPFPMAKVLVPDVPRPPTQTFSAEEIRAGAALYRTDFCAGCHAPEADGSGAWVMDGAIPDLRYMPPSAHLQWNAIVMKGTRARNGMPGFENPPGFPIVTKRMTQQEADAIHAYVIDLQWKAFNEDQKRLKGTSKH